MTAIESFREFKNCLSCGSSKQKIIYEWDKNEYDHSEFETCSWDGREAIDLKTVKCENCKLVYTNPAFKSDALDKVYPPDLISDRKKFKSLPFDHKWYELGKLIESYLKKNSVVCDVGTRYGQFPSYLNKLKLNAFGIEINSTAVEIGKSKGFPIHEGRIETLQSVCNDLAIDRINAFVLDDVLEHLCQPKNELKMLSQFQESGDFLFLRQMNYDSLGRKLYGKNWYYFQPAAHMVYFSEKTIVPFLNDLGYDVVEIKKAGLLKNILYWLKIKVGDLLLKLGIGQFINKIFGKKLVKSRAQIFNGKLNYNSYRNKLDDIFTVIAKKR